MNGMLRVVAATLLLHITPVIVLIKRPAAVQALLPGANAYFQRDLHLSDRDAHRLHEVVDWSPENDVLTFYLGRSATADVGTLEFVRVDTPHGPIEVAVGFTPVGAVRQVLVTKATVEMKPWVQDAEGAGLLRSYAGLQPSQIPAGAAAVSGKTGSLAVYVAGEIDKGVQRALTAYSLFYRPGATRS
jgi:hypothetical protein